MKLTNFTKLCVCLTIYVGSLIMMVATQSKAFVIANLGGHLGMSIVLTCWAVWGDLQHKD